MCPSVPGQDTEPSIASVRQCSVNQCCKFVWVDAYAIYQLEGRHLPIDEKTTSLNLDQGWATQGLEGQCICIISRYPIPYL